MQALLKYFNLVKNNITSFHSILGGTYLFLQKMLSFLQAHSNKYIWKVLAMATHQNGAYNSDSLEHMGIKKGWKGL